MDLQLRGAGVLVTGASRGLGRDLARAFAAEGANVAICARTPGPIEELAAELRTTGVQALAIQADLTNDNDCRKAVDGAARAFGRLDALVNNATRNVDSTPKKVEDATDEQVLARIHGKTMPAVRCSRHALPHMRRAGGGRIVLIGGSAARTIMRGDELMNPGSTLPQSFGNAALSAFAKHLSEEVARDRIVVNVVHPHTIDTGRFQRNAATRAAELGITPEEMEARMLGHVPTGRVLRGADIAPLVLLLASPLASQITSQSIAIDGGALRAINY